MKTFTLRLASLLVSTLIVIPTVRGQTPNGLDMFLKLDDVKGSSTASGFKDQMVALDFNFSITNMGGSISSSAGKAQPGDLVIIKPIDRATPVLAQAAASGAPYQQAILSVRLPKKGEQNVVFTITLSNVP